MTATQRWLATVAAGLVGGCSLVLGLDELSYDEVPGGGGAASQTGGPGGATTNGSTSTSSTGGSPSTSTGSMGAGGPGGCDLLDIKFDTQAELDCWTEGPDQATATATLEPGALVVATDAIGAWYMTDRSWFIFREVSGNFAVEVSLEVESIANPGQPPTPEYNAAGLLARDGSTPQENWVLYDVGQQAVTDGAGTVHKSTTDGETIPSPPTFHTSSYGDATRAGRLVLCRIENDFYMFQNFDGSWIQDEGPLERADFDQKALQVGIIVSAFAGPADARATFDYVHFAPDPPAMPSECTASF